MWRRYPTRSSTPPTRCPRFIANNYGEMMSVPLYESALMSAALLLLIAVIIFNISARAVIVAP